jgi:hypothetical protein
MELTGPLLDGSSYAIDRSGTPVELCLRAPVVPLPCRST